MAITPTLSTLQNSTGFIVTTLQDGTISAKKKAEQYVKYRDSNTLEKASYTPEEYVFTKDGQLISGTIRTKIVSYQKGSKLRQNIGTKEAYTQTSGGLKRTVYEKVPSRSGRREKLSFMEEEVLTAQGFERTRATNNLTPTQKFNRGELARSEEGRFVEVGTEGSTLSDSAQARLAAQARADTAPLSPRRVVMDSAAQKYYGEQLIGSGQDTPTPISRAQTFSQAARQRYNIKEDSFDQVTLIAGGRQVVASGIGEISGPQGFTGRTNFLDGWRKDISNKNKQLIRKQNTQQTDFIIKPIMPKMVGSTMSEADRKGFELVGASGTEFAPTKSGTEWLSTPITGQKIQRQGTQKLALFPNPFDPNTATGKFNIRMGNLKKELADTTNYIAQQDRLGKPVSYGTKYKYWAASLGTTALSSAGAFTLNAPQTVIGTLQFYVNPIQGVKDLGTAFRTQPLQTSSDLLTGVLLFSKVGETSRLYRYGDSKAIGWVGPSYSSWGRLKPRTIFGSGKEASFTGGPLFKGRFRTTNTGSGFMFSLSGFDIGKAGKAKYDIGKSSRRISKASLRKMSYGIREYGRSSTRRPQTGEVLVSGKGNPYLPNIKGVKQTLVYSPAKYSASEFGLEVLTQKKQLKGIEFKLPKGKYARGEVGGVTVLSKTMFYDPSINKVSIKDFVVKPVKNRRPSSQVKSPKGKLSGDYFSSYSSSSNNGFIAYFKKGKQVTTFEFSKQKYTPFSYPKQKLKSKGTSQGPTRSAQYNVLTSVTKKQKVYALKAKDLFAGDVKFKPGFRPGMYQRYKARYESAYSIRQAEVFNKPSKGGILSSLERSTYYNQGKLLPVASMPRSVLNVGGRMVGRVFKKRLKSRVVVDYTMPQRVGYSPTNLFGVSRNAFGFGKIGLLLRTGEALNLGSGSKSSLRLTQSLGLGTTQIYGTKQAQTTAQIQGSSLTNLNIVGSSPKSVKVGRSPSTRTNTRRTIINPIPSFFSSPSSKKSRSKIPKKVTTRKPPFIISVPKNVLRVTAKKGKKKKDRRRNFFYTPSIEANIFGTKGKGPGRITGLELRPIRVKI